ncbi:MAG: hypothetical protein WC869_05305 [Phycisphaerae bacterium]|jgi:hypothetical protein
MCEAIKAGLKRLLDFSGGWSIRIQVVQDEELTGLSIVPVKRFGGPK